MTEDSKFMLEPCPLCDEHPILRLMTFYANGEKSPAYVKCKTCGISVASFDGDADAVEKWNRRPQVERLRARAAEVEETLRFDLATVTENYRRLLDEHNQLKAGK